MAFSSSQIIIKVNVLLNRYYKCMKQGAKESLKVLVMHKKDLIESIIEINSQAKVDILEHYSEEELEAYLRELIELRTEQLLSRC